MAQSKANDTDAIIDLLACPVTGSHLHREGDELVSRRGGLRYPIRDGIPVLLSSAAVVPEGTGGIKGASRVFERP